MTTATFHTVNFGVVEDYDDAETFECLCGLVYRVFPRALGLRWPHGYASPVAISPDGKYRLDGTMCVLVPEDDDGERPYLRVRWACPCGTLCSYLQVMRDTVDCRACDKAALRRSASKPSDYYLNPRYGMACSCCGQQGTHLVRRDGLDLPGCME